MNRIRLLLIGSAITLMTATTAQANAIYNWQSTDPGSYVTATGGELVVTNAAYRSGSINEMGRRSNSPVISVSFTFGFTDGSEGIPDLVVSPRRSTADFDDRFISALDFNADGTLSGSMLLLSDSESDGAQAAGTHRSWSVFDYGSDFFSGEECGGTRCDGGFGFWQLSRVEPSTDVPAPPAWPLFTLGVLGLFGLLKLPRKA